MVLLGEKVLLRLIDESITESGIILAVDEDKKPKPDKGYIVKVGNKVTGELKEGDKVAFDKNVGRTFNHEGEDLWMIIQDGVYGVIL